MLIKWTDIDLEKHLQLGPVVDVFKTLGWAVRSIPSSSHNKQKTIGAYLIIHPATNKCYVGSHNDLYCRPYQHNSLLNRKNHWIDEFQKAYDEDPRIMPMFIIANDREKAYDIEQNIISKFYDTGLLFNIAKDARLSMTGLDVSEETRIKLSIAGSKRTLTQEHRDKIALANKGHKHSNDTIAKIKSKAIERGIPLEMTKKAALVNSRAIIVDDVRYDSIVKFSELHKVPPSTIRKRLFSKKFPSWHYVTDIFDRSMFAKGVVYASVYDCAKAFGLNVDIIKLRIDSNNEVYADWYYVDNAPSL